MPLYHYKIIRLGYDDGPDPDATVAATLAESACTIIPLFRPKSEVGEYLADPDTFALFEYEVRERAAFLLPDISAEGQYARYVTDVLDTIRSRHNLELSEPLLVVVITDKGHSHVFSILNLSEEDPGPLRACIRDVKNCLGTANPVKRLTATLAHTNFAYFTDDTSSFARTLIETDHPASPNEPDDSLYKFARAERPQAINYDDYIATRDQELVGDMVLLDATTRRLSWRNGSVRLKSGRGGRWIALLVRLFSMPEQPLPDSQLMRALRAAGPKAATSYVRHNLPGLNGTPIQSWVVRADSCYQMVPDANYVVIAKRDQLPPHLR